VVRATPRARRDRWPTLLASFDFLLIALSPLAPIAPIVRLPWHRSRRQVNCRPDGFNQVRVVRFRQQRSVSVCATTNRSRSS
jgi:hypothetical protein